MADGRRRRARDGMFDRLASNWAFTVTCRARLRSCRVNAPWRPTGSVSQSLVRPESRPKPVVACRARLRREQASPLASDWKGCHRIRPSSWSSPGLTCPRRMRHQRQGDGPRGCRSPSPARESAATLYRRKAARERCRLQVDGHRVPLLEGQQSRGAASQARRRCTPRASALGVEPAGN